MSGSRRSPGASVALVVGLLAAVLATVLVLGRPADAHARLVSTVPGADEVVDVAPQSVELRFDEAVDVTGRAVRVFDPAGVRVEAGEPRTSEDGRLVSVDVEADDPGTYTVAWRVTSADGHTISGSFVYHVDDRTGAVAIDESTSVLVSAVGGVGRWAGFAGGLLAVGAAALALVADGAGESGRARLRSVVVVGAVVGSVGVLAALVAALAESAGRGLGDVADLLADAPDSRTGRLALARAGLLEAAAVAAAAPALWRRTPVPALVAAAGALPLASLAGHAWTAPHRGIAVAADVVHLGAAAVWTGGVVALLLVLPLVDDRHRLASRFSALAVGAVAAVAVTGAVSGWQQARTLEALTTTTYGQLLLAKVALFGGVVALGWVNRSRLVPIVARTTRPLTRSLRIEIVLATAVLAVTAALVQEAPARATMSGPVELSATVGEATASGSVVPGRAGTNDIHLFFSDRNGAPLGFDAVQIEATRPDVPPRRLPVVPISPDHIVAAGVSLPTAGTWTFEVTAVREGEPLTFTFEVQIR